MYLGVVLSAKREYPAPQVMDFGSIGAHAHPAPFTVVKLCFFTANAALPIHDASIYILINILSKLVQRL